MLVLRDVAAIGMLKAKIKSPAATGQFAAGVEDGLRPLSPLSRSDLSLAPRSATRLSLASLSPLPVRAEASQSGPLGESVEARID